MEVLGKMNSVGDCDFHTWSIDTVFCISILYNSNVLGDQVCKMKRLNNNTMMPKRCNVGAYMPGSLQGLECLCRRPLTDTTADNSGSFWLTNKRTSFLSSPVIGWPNQSRKESKFQLSNKSRPSVTHLKAVLDLGALGFNPIQMDKMSTKTRHNERRRSRDWVCHKPHILKKPEAFRNRSVLTVKAINRLTKQIIQCFWPSLKKLEAVS